MGAASAARAAASGPSGSAVAAAEGANVVMTARNERVLAEAVADIGQGNAVALPGDLADPDAAERLVEVRLPLHDGGEDPFSGRALAHHGGCGVVAGAFEAEDREGLDGGGPLDVLLGLRVTDLAVDPELFGRSEERGLGAESSFRFTPYPY